MEPGLRAGEEQLILREARRGRNRDEQRQRRFVSG